MSAGRDVSRRRFQGAPFATENVNFPGGIESSLIKVSFWLNDRKLREGSVCADSFAGIRSGGIDGWPKIGGGKSPLRPRLTQTGVRNTQIVIGFHGASD